LALCHFSYPIPLSLFTLSCAAHNTPQKVTLVFKVCALKDFAQKLAFSSVFAIAQLKFFWFIANSL